MKKIGLGLLAIVVIFLIVVATRPSTFHVERSTTIAAPVDIVFPELNSMKAFGDWNPWDKLDPKMKKTFEGPDSGVGSTYSWIGNDDVGQGRMRIVESKPNEKVAHILEFIEPFPATNNTAFLLKPAGNGSTTVTWTMDGNKNFMAKAAGMFMDMDKMIGKDFEAGLKNLGALAEAKAKAAAASAPTAP